MWASSIFIILIPLFGGVAAFPQSRVVNGTDSDITKYPFMVSLRRTSGSHSCGASIIASRWILTAAHCVVDSVASDLNIQYAVTKINKAGPNIVPVKRIITHAEYNPDAHYINDIALLELDGQLIFNYKTIAPVSLPDENFDIPQIPEGAPGTLIGWGRNMTGGLGQEHLQEVDLKIFSDEECALRHKNNTDGKYQICGGVDEGGKGQCSGDSGGPLLYGNTNVQLGIVSWSVKPCAIYPYPGVYTKVSRYIEWIRKNII